MWDILSSSRTTIHTLSLPFGVDDEPTCLRLWNMHFPHLRSLTLGIWTVEAEPEVADANDFTDFILVHSDTIEELDMDYGEYDDEYALEFDNSSLTRLRANSLPRLRSFRGNASSFRIMAQAGMICLTTTLRCLVVGPGGIEPIYELQSMFDTILSPATGGVGGPVLGGLFGLKELDLNISQRELWRWDEIVGAIRQCAECCGPSLEVWRGTIPSVLEMDAEDFGLLFGAFGRLRVIHLNVGIIPEVNYDDEDAGATYAHLLALSCRALEAVFLIYSFQRTVQWKVTRTQTSGESSICSVRRQSAE